MNKEERKALVVRPSAAVEKIGSGAGSVLSRIVSDAVVLARSQRPHALVFASAIMILERLTISKYCSGQKLGKQPQLLRQRLVAARSSAPEDFQHQMGWVLTAFQNAFYWLLSGANLADAVIETVGKGGDPDTNAAICGALLGAALGRDAVPLQWRNAVLTCRPVRAKEARHPRPKTYWPDDALELAEALVAAGQVRSACN